MDYKIFWTNEAINNLEEILNYLIKTGLKGKLIILKNHWQSKFS